MKENNLLYFCGDTHGNYKELVWRITKRYGIRGASIVVLGDFGVGFDNTLDDNYQWSASRLEETDNTIYVIRGNHDDPKYFEDENKYSYPRLKFLEDHKVYNICGRDIYTIGGACSTDITWRIAENERLGKTRKKRKVWWEDEGVVKKYSDLPNKADIIISHTAPLAFLPVITKFSETPLEQYEKILSERRYLDYVLENINAKYWCYGHFHNHYSGSFGNLLYRGLGIMEFYEVPEIINENPQGEEKDGQELLL